ncbi:S8 family serine peptidase [Candidatus Poribacteria bacterium]|nr:S8 family serine peptidase [Candidatus Poribacteria bacterium]
MDLSKYTGRGVKIGLIDSGVDRDHPAIHNIKAGISIKLDSQRRLYLSDDFEDQHGHGTGCAYIISKLAPHSELYVVKVFEEKLLCEERRVVEAIRWLIEQKVDIINLSMQSPHEESRDTFQPICEEALESGMMLIAARDPTVPVAYPADLEGVIGVVPIKACGRYEYLYIRDGDRWYLGARGDLQRLADKGGGFTLNRGPSYAAPHITAITALMMEALGSKDRDEVIKTLISNASGEIEGLRSHPVHLPINPPPAPPALPENRPSRVQIRKASLYPYTDEMRLLVRYRSQLSFSLVGTADTLDCELMGKDAGEPLGLKPAGFRVVHDLKKACSKADTLIVGDLSRMNMIFGMDATRAIITRAIDLDVNVYSIQILNPDSYADLFDMARRRRLSLNCPSINCLGEPIDLRCVLPLSRITVPMMAIFGTRAEHRAFELQLLLREKLLRERCKVACLGTDNRSELFNFEICFPMDVHTSMKIPPGEQMHYLQAGVSKVFKEINPDLILIGSQVHLIPVEVDDIGVMGSIAVSLSLKPDYYVLQFEPEDPIEFLGCCLDFIRSFGRGEIVALVMNDMNITSDQELDERILMIGSSLQIPALRMGDPELGDKIVRLMCEGENGVER